MSYVSQNGHRMPTVMTASNGQVVYHPPPPPTEPSIKSNYTTSSKDKYGAALNTEVQVMPNPLCPPIKNLCCLMVLFNLALLLICLGFAIVLQLYDPPFVWYVGLVCLIFGFVTWIGCFIWCAVMCQRHREELNHRPSYEDDLYWTRRWSKTITLGEVQYDNESQLGITRSNYNSRYHTPNGTMSRHEDSLPERAARMEMRDARY